MTTVRTETFPIGLDRLSRDKMARWAGATYLTYIALGAPSMILQSRQIAWSDLTLTFLHIQQGTQLFRLSFFLEILAIMFFLLATWSYFVLLKPVERNARSDASHEYVALARGRGRVHRRNSVLRRLAISFRLADLSIRLHSPLLGCSPHC